MPLCIFVDISAANAPFFMDTNKALSHMTEVLNREVEVLTNERFEHQHRIEIGESTDIVLQLQVNPFEPPTPHCGDFVPKLIFGQEARSI